MVDQIICLAASAMVSSSKTAVSSYWNTNSCNKYPANCENFSEASSLKEGAKILAKQIRKQYHWIVE